MIDRNSPTRGRAAAPAAALVTAWLCALPGPAAAGPPGIEAADAVRTPEAVSALPSESADWQRARLLPAAIVLASSEARRADAAQAETLEPGADGSVDLALATVIDLTLRNNLDLQVRSYDPALSAEAIKAQEAIYDPLLRFTLALFSSTSPTTATLAGAEVLSRDQWQWNAEANKLLPTGGTFGFSLTNSRDSSNNSFNTLDPAYNVGIGVNLSQPLLRGRGRSVTEREIRIARNNRQASAEGFRNQVMGKVTEVVDAYWDLYGRIDNLAVIHEGLALAKDLLRINRTRVEVGTMAPIEISAAEAEVARNEELLIAAEADVRTAQDRILQLVNLPVGSATWKATLRPVDVIQIDEHPIDVEDSIRVALAERPELKQIQIGVANDQIRLDFARDQLKPSLALTASYSFVGLGGTQIVRSPDGSTEQRIPGDYFDAFDSLSSFRYDTWRVGAVLDFPLRNQLAQANHAAAFLGVRRDQDNLEALKQTISVDVRRLARAVETNRKSIQAAGVTRELQEKRLDAERKKFEHGLSTNFEVQQAQKDLTQARTSEVGARTNYQRGLAALELAMGVVMERHGIHVQE